MHKQMAERVPLRFTLALLLTATIAVFLPVSARADASVSPTDANIQYFGRWDRANSAAYSSALWPGTYLKVNFTGTSLKVVLGSTEADIEASIDGAPFRIYQGSPNAVIDLAETSLSSGLHSLVLVPHGDGSTEFEFAGLLLSDSGATQPAPAPRRIIEFVGDSITVGYGSSGMPTRSYAWRIAESVGAEHVQIAHGGMCLPDGYSCTGVNTVGMISSYSHKENIEASPSSPWDFSAYTPSQVVVNIGTNDSGHGVPNDVFQSNYVELLTDIRHVHPSAEILALRPFGGYKASQVKYAVDSRVSAGDANVFFVDTTGWLGSADYADTVHPNDAGIDKVITRLRPILEGCSPWRSNLARCEQYAASSEWSTGQAASFAFDGSDSTNWQAAPYSAFGGQWLQVDFGGMTTFNQAVLSEYGGRTSGFRLEYWTGQSWVAAYSGTTIGSKSAPSVHNFAAVTATKARIYYTSGTGTPIMYEFKLHNTGAGYSTAKSWNFNVNGNTESWSSLQLSGLVANGCF
ncbi:lysophospholipase L1-like esterase [Microbacterium natoriense]|uniref:Lysophospholipase L1-like esterase n=1 Tax=Microbacterium natoriense TaxID=284570 RepID=A0AAW8ERQ2_9MICO|nr:GDSL-type esterase/lipase family protein [Microbacterium natoriense]MDQ0646211.1 lysophospholipase L1-like esterase [Microbacterium natoriense]